MNKNMIAVWGNAGAGKSLISCALANSLATAATPVIVINTDKLTPMFRSYLPTVEQKPVHSLGKLLTGGITLGTLKDKVQVHPSNKNLGFMALVDGDNSLNYQSDWSMDAMQRLTQLLVQHELATYIIFDCGCDVFADKGTLFALEHAGAVVSAASPDSRSLAFAEAQAPILRGGNFHATEHITVLNNAYPYSPTKQMVKDWGFQYILPHAYDAYKKFVGGQLICKLDGVCGHAFECELAQLKQKVVTQLGA